MRMIMAVTAASLLAAAGAALAQPYSVLGGAPISLMTEKDIALYQEALSKALDQGKNGEVSRWSNAESGASGTIEPKRDFTRGDKKCRDLFTETKAKGRSESGTWAFCREPGGAWKFSPGADNK
jgi:surface antigen